MQGEKKLNAQNVYEFPGSDRVLEIDSHGAWHIGPGTGPVHISPGEGQVIVHPGQGQLVVSPGQGQVIVKKGGTGQVIVDD